MKRWGHTDKVSLGARHMNPSNCCTGVARFWLLVNVLLYVE